MTGVLYAGFDVSLEVASTCVDDADGGVIFEANAISEPAEIGVVLAGVDGTFKPIGFEAGPLSKWL